MHVFGICKKSYGQYIPNVKSTEKYEVLRLGFIRLKRAYGEDVPRHQNRKTDDYVIQDKNDNKKSANIKIEPIKTENVKTR